MTSTLDVLTDNSSQVRGVDKTWHWVSRVGCCVTVQSDPTYLDVTVAGTLVNACGNAHAHYRLIFELSESARSQGMASVTHKRSVVKLERKLGVTRMLEDGKSQQSVSSVLHSEFWAFSHIWTPVVPTLPG